MTRGMRYVDPADHCMFIDEQVSVDLAFGCLVEAHTWESLRDAIQRVEAVDPLRNRLPPTRYGGLGLA